MENTETTMETWKPVVGFDGFYEVSNLGRVRSVRRACSQPSRHGGMMTRQVGGKVLAPKIYKDGYCTVTLKAVAIGVDADCRLVHRLVLEAFVGPCPAGMQVRHFPDRSKSNNCLDNLSWGTPIENQADRHIHGTAVNGESSHLAKLSAEQVIAIRQRLEADEKIRHIAHDYGVDEATVGHIKAGRSWRHLP